MARAISAHPRRIARWSRGMGGALLAVAFVLPRGGGAETLTDALNKHFSNLEQVAAEAHLSDHCLQKIAKAKRMLGTMVATLAFFWLTLRAKVEALALPPAVERAVYDQLIPAIYLDAVSEKVAEASQRHTLKNKVTELLAPLHSAASPLQSLAPADLQVIEQVAQECAELFQRSSSCVEGRNGQLALRHHSLHRLRDQKLAALTTVHNYFIRRSDGTTAAERFFGAKPGNLFEWVLERVDLPGWPAQKRSEPRPKRYLAPAIAGA